jgi:hypothetical protein
MGSSSWRKNIDRPLVGKNPDRPFPYFLTPNRDFYYLTRRPLFARSVSPVWQDNVLKTNSQLPKRFGFASRSEVSNDDFAWQPGAGPIQPEKRSSHAPEQ